MKIKLICGAIVTTASLASGAQAIGQEIQADGSANGVVVRKYSGEAAKPFFNAFVEKVRLAAQSSDPTTSKGAIEYLNRLESGQVTGYIHETSRPLTAQEVKTGIAPESEPIAPPTFQGQTSIDQTCTKQSNNSYIVVDQTYVGAGAGASLQWQLQRSITSVMSICPMTAI